ncbi:MAG: molybdate ABC transporter substrate-binding protein [Solirubrobacteraceae bacterium]|nr:molybdate ABC transporter substrate-binding protein [Solirubrobacteraceae bacterium]
MRTLRRTALLTSIVALAAAPLAGCGDDEPTSGEGGTTATNVTLKVSAATSLKTAMEDFGGGFTAARSSFSFAGSDELAAQIRQGVRPDVYAAASTKLPDALHAEGLLEEPVEFATNSLIVAVPAKGSKVATFDDLGDAGVKLAIGSDTVPVGSYTRTVLGRLPDATRKAIEGNVRSEEPNVSGVVGKLTQGAVDAGFVYASDVHAAGDALRVVDIPDELEPTVRYGAAVVKDAPHPEQARAFLDALKGPDGQFALQAAGLGPKP